MHELAGNRSAALPACAGDAVPAVSLFVAPLPEARPSSDGHHSTHDDRPPTSAAASQSKRQPAGLFIICGAELCERFAGSFPLSLLVLYLIEELGTSPGAAIRRVGLFNALGYLAALAGGGFVGRVLAAPHGAIVGALLLAAGFSVMAAERSMGLLAALALLSAGSGLFRPSITLLLDRLYPRQDGRRDAGHIWFWMAINIGGALAPLVAGSLRIVAGFGGGVHRGHAEHLALRHDTGRRSALLGGHRAT